MTFFPKTAFVVVLVALVLLPGDATEFPFLDSWPGTLESLRGQRENTA